MTEDSGVDDLAPAGWYPDPKLRSRQRYFDGQAWSPSVRQGTDVTHDPLGPLPAGRDSWLSPRTMEMLARPNERSAWQRHRGRIAAAGCAVTFCAVVVLALVRPAAAMAYFIVVAVAVMVGVRFWLAAAFEEQRASGERWFPRE